MDLIGVSQILPEESRSITEVRDYAWKACVGLQGLVDPGHSVTHSMDTDGETIMLLSKAANFEASGCLKIVSENVYLDEISFF